MTSILRLIGLYYGVIFNGMILLFLGKIFIDSFASRNILKIGSFGILTVLMLAWCIYLFKTTIKNKNETT